MFLFHSSKNSPRAYTPDRRNEWKQIYLYIYKKKKLLRSLVTRFMAYYARIINIYVGIYKLQLTLYSRAQVLNPWTISNYKIHRKTLIIYLFRSVFFFALSVVLSYALNTILLYKSHDYKRTCINFQKKKNKYLKQKIIIIRRRNKIRKIEYSVFIVTIIFFTEHNTRVGSILYIYIHHVERKKRRIESIIIHK